VTGDGAIPETRRHPRHPVPASRRYLSWPGISPGHPPECSVLQGAFILAKATGGPEVAAESIDHLRRYVEMLFKRPEAKETAR
jgi:hypothetical protein